MRWGKLVERSALLVCEDAPSGCIESIEQGAAAQQIVPDRCEQLRNLGLMVAYGAHGIAMLGTSGENCSLEFAEKTDLLEAVVERRDGSLLVLSGVAEFTSAQAFGFAHAANRAYLSGSRRGGLAQSDRDLADR